MKAFRRPQPRAEDIPIFDGRGCTLFELSQMKCRWPISNPAPKISASAGTSQSKDCPIAWGTHALHISRKVGSAATAVPTGIRVADVEIGAFLIAAPEKQELVRLIGTPV